MRKSTSISVEHSSSDKVIRTPILILHHEGNTLNNPSLRALVSALTDRGHCLYIRIPKRRGKVSPLDSVTFIPHGKIYNNIFEVGSRYPKLRFLIKILSYCELLFFLRGRNFDRIIGADRLGLILGGELAKQKKIPLIYINFEIQFEKEVGFNFKSNERHYRRQVTSWITQDATRRDQLVRENLLPKDSCFLLPLASRGLPVPNKNRLRDSLKIPGDKKVALSFGSQADWTMTRQIIDSVRFWQEEWVIIIHERFSEINWLRKLVNNLSSGHRKKIFLSEKHYPDIDNLSELFSGVDVGIAFYKPQENNIYLNRNIKYLGMSSGKISSCCRYGVPIIMNEIGIYSDLAKRHGFGHVVENPSKIPQMLDNTDWSRMGQNAKNFFERELDFKCFERDIIELITAG